MKLSQFMYPLAAGLVLALATSGCKHQTRITPLPGARTGQLEGNNPGSGGTIGQGAGASALTSTGIAPNTPGSHAGWQENPDVLKPDTVYFDFDSSAIKGSEQPKVAAVADYLKGNPQAAVRVEGNCDERGTEEYNRSLGERRALAVREALVALGIDPSRVDTISYGEDRPADPGHNEAAWRKNRRDDFVVLTPP